MNKRLEMKVGLFVLVCLVLLAVLLLQFTKGVSLFRKTYTVILNTANVGGLKPHATVLMSGVPVGFVNKTLLSPNGTNVSVYLKIFNEYLVPTNSEFKIEQSGFLGDQYVAIYPGQNVGVALTDGAEVHATEPFNIQEVAAKVNRVLDAVQHVVLNTNTLTNVAVALVKLKGVAERADIAVSNINGLIISNTVPLKLAISNLVVFSDELKQVGARADNLVITNAPQINAAVSNLYAATATVTNLLGEVEAGHGAVGQLIKNDALARDIRSMAASFSATSTNLAVASANLNRLGLWHFLWYHPKPEQKPLPPPHTSQMPEHYKQ